MIAGSVWRTLTLAPDGSAVIWFVSDPAQRRLQVRRFPGGASLLPTGDQPPC